MSEDPHITYRLQRLAVRRAFQILSEIYPTRILQKKQNGDGSPLTKEGARFHLKCLKEAVNTLERLDTMEIEENGRQERE